MLQLLTVIGLAFVFGSGTLFSILGARQNKKKGFIYISIGFSLYAIGFWFLTAIY